MKLDITIRDASLEQTQIILEALNGGALSAKQPTVALASIGHNSNADLIPQNREVQPVITPTFPQGTQTPITPATHPANQQQQETIQTSDKTLDVNGLPWDERIHSGKTTDKVHTRNADGAWKKRKGVTAETTSAVEAELRGRVLQQPQMQQPVQQQPQMQGMPNFNAAPDAPVQQQAADAPGGQPNFGPTPNFLRAENQPAQVQQQDMQFDKTNFNQLMIRANNAQQSARVESSYFTGLCSRIGHYHGTTIASLGDLMNRPTLISYANDLMTQDNLGI